MAALLVPAVLPGTVVMAVQLVLVASVVLREQRQLLALAEHSLPVDLLARTLLLELYNFLGHQEMLLPLEETEEPPGLQE